MKVFRNAREARAAGRPLLGVDPMHVSSLRFSRRFQGVVGADTSERTLLHEAPARAEAHQR